MRTGVSDRVVPLPQTSTVACELLRRAGVRSGLIHIDASHEYEDVLRDVFLYWEILEPGGYLVGDDYHQNWPSVIKAADELAARKGVVPGKSFAEMDRPKTGLTGCRGGQSSSLDCPPRKRQRRSR